MLKQYKLVSIIYGGSGTKYAKEMNALIQRRSEDMRYPITSKIVMESVLTGDLLTSITDLFTQTEYCLAFLTSDHSRTIPQYDKLLERELETYMLKSEQLERLVFIQNLLEKRRSNDGNSGPMSEDML